MPKIRLDLDFMPSPVPDRPGLLIRDPYGYSSASLIVPPALISTLQLFDGESSELDIRHHLVQITGDLQAGEIATHLIGTLDEAGFLDNGRFGEMKEARRKEFVDSPERLPRHAGNGGYPENREELRRVFEGYFNGEPATPKSDVLGIAAPHVSPFGGWESYADAYRAIPRSAADRIFVVLGTSHYGEPDCFGLTRKAFVTPYGATRAVVDEIDHLEAAAPGAVLMEDYCHAIEHSIEFQVIFLQHLFGPDIRVLPLLCGPFAKARRDGVPEDDENVRRFFEALAELQARKKSELFWVLGIDMAHVGQRYGDRFAAEANSGHLAEVEEKDRSRLEAVARGDSRAFWDGVQQLDDELRWCGSSPMYTFLRAVGASGSLLRYQQWNIDPSSVVSFAALSFENG